MEIAGYIKTSLIEWPGKISSVIFVPGCNFRCPFCHNA
ncbi:anaerobic ribonucleoside-triphosphate reductase activating protein, partial [Candidatus Shapirobacteria bacterium CG_4_8_14_3_um_filter_39_11]